MTLELPEIAPVGPDEYAEIERSFAELVGSRQDFLLVQGEATLWLEAAARSLGGPGARVLNIVTGPYGAALGGWFRQAGSEVDELVVPFDRAVTIGAVAERLAADGGIEIVSVVHAEAATGAVNPLRELAAIVRAAGALLVVDAVASLGAEPIEIDRWELDLVVLSAQKALSGPTGVSGVVVGDRAWSWIESNPAAPRSSVLSLLDWREHWLGSSRRTLPVIPHHVETRLLGQRLAELSGVLGSVVEAHAAARDATRRGLRALGLAPWVESDRAAAAVATTVRSPNGTQAAGLLAAALDGRPAGDRPPLAAAPGRSRTSRSESGIPAGAQGSARSFPRSPPSRSASAGSGSTPISGPRSRPPSGSRTGREARPGRQRGCRDGAGGERRNFSRSRRSGGLRWSALPREENGAEWRTASSASGRERRPAVRDLWLREDQIEKEETEHGFENR